MHLLQRAVLYLTRKKGKSIILCALFLLVSFSLFIGVSVLSGTDQASKDLRSNIGASFDIRPYEQLEFENGEVSSEGTPTVDEKSIQEVLSCIGDELRNYNTEQYGYAKGTNLSFIKGASHNSENNMGKVTSLRDSSLSKDFINEERKLIEGSHIKPEDKNKILISKELAEENRLKVGDTVELTHANLGSQSGVYVDLIPKKTEFVVVEIAGIYQLEVKSENGLIPTANKEENLIYSSSNLLLDLKEQKENIYEGEISFFIKDPLHLEEMTQKVKEISSIDWNNHILVNNDFKYSKIADQLQGIQNIVMALIVITSVLGIITLVIILTMRIRGRIHETGIMLSIGKTKFEIISQFVIEKIILLSLGFVLALLIFIPVSNMLNPILFGSLTDVSKKTIDIITSNTNYLQLNAIQSLLLFMGEMCAVILTVILSSGAVLSLKPKEILSKMS
ncbi:FtsX-like permease family protein [Clostridiales bacterium CHKCI001]|nr:FtsX-like permease family protein [Clostridiales bacterium CHKCI001]